LSQVKSMRKLLTFISIVFISASLACTKVSAQVSVGIGDYQMCYHVNTSMPVTVQNMIGVDSMRLVLNFNTTAIDYTGYLLEHPALAGGTFTVSSSNGSVIINWSRNSSASIFNDTLVWLKFKGQIGATSLTWQTAECFFHTSGGNLSANYTNGSANVNPEIKVRLSEIDPTCEDRCDANYMANAWGGSPTFTYRWNGKPGRFDSIQTNLCAKQNLLTITDSKGCKLDTVFTIKGLPGADVNMVIEGNEDTTIYLQNPVLTFSFQEVFPTHVVEAPLWEFGDGDTARSFNPTHVFSRANTNTDGYYDVTLTILNDNGCGSQIVQRIPIKEAKLNIPGVITPNGDSFNETFMIIDMNKDGTGEQQKVTSEFQSMELTIYDRWGRKIYSDSNYQNDWSGKGASDGAYYYILKTIGYYQTDKYKGAITILGSTNN
jgi:hypothetical protein